MNSWTAVRSQPSKNDMLRRTYQIALAIDGVYWDPGIVPMWIWLPIRKPLVATDLVLVEETLDERHVNLICAERRLFRHVPSNVPDESIDRSSIFVRRDTCPDRRGKRSQSRTCTNTRCTSKVQGLASNMLRLHKTARLHGI